MPLLAVKPQLGLFGALLCLGLTTVSAGPAPAQPADWPNTVAGTLVDERGLPVADVEVVLRPYPSDYEVGRHLLGATGTLPEAVDRAVSGSDGSYSLSAPLAGPYRIEIWPPAPPDQPAATSPLVHGALTPLKGFQIAEPIEVPNRHRIAVRVLDTDDQPVEGALIIADPDPWRSPGYTGALRQRRNEARDGRRSRLQAQQIYPTYHRHASRTGSDGIARFLMPVAKTRVLVSAPGFALAERRAGAGKATFRLERDPGLVLHAFDPAGEPAAGAVIRTDDVRGTPLAVTDDLGSATLSVASRRTTTFDLETSDHAIGRTTPIQGFSPADSPSGRVVTVRLAAPDRVRGLVVDSATGLPIPGAAVWVESEPGRRAPTDRSGRFELTVRPGKDQEQVRIASAGYAPTWVNVSTAAPDDSPRIPIGLVPAAPLFGWIVDDSGEPVAGADVLAEAGGWPPSIRAASGFDGGFWIPTASYDVAYRLHVSAPGFAQATRDVPPLSAHSTEEPLHIMLAKGLPGRGRVVDTGSRPIPNATVQLQLPRTINETNWWDNHEFETATTNVHGEFVFQAVGVGQYLIQASHPGHVPSPHTRVDVAATLNEADLGTLTLRPGLELNGRVRDRKGGPIAGAKVVAAWREQEVGVQGRQAITDTNGRFEFRGLGTEPVDLLVTAENYLPRHEPGVQAGGEDPVSIELAAGSASLRGLVVDPNGNPVANAPVSAYCLDMAPSRLLYLDARQACIRSTTTNSAGRFEFDVLSPGSWSIGVQDPADQGMRGKVESVELGMDESTEVEVRLRAADRLIVAVTNRQGAPVPEALVNAASASPAALGSTDATGRATLFMNLESPITSAVAASHPDYADQLQLLELRPGVNEVHLELDAGWEITGFVRSRDGSSIAMATVEATPENGLSDVDEGEVIRQWASPARTSSDANGWFRFRGLARGRYSVKARLSGYTEGGLAGPVEIDGRSAAGVEIRLEAVPPE